MNTFSLILATILVWTLALAGSYQRFFEMPKWIANPPSSFQLIRNQWKRARLFWIPMSLLLVCVVGLALKWNWNTPPVRTYILGSILCLALSAGLGAIYFVRELVAFSNTPLDAPKTPSLVIRAKFWLRWTFILDILQLAAAVLITVARARLGH